VVESWEALQQDDDEMQVPPQFCCPEGHAQVPLWQT
jgi:hypothetical protein